MTHAVDAGNFLVAPVAGHEVSRLVSVKGSNQTPTMVTLTHAAGLDLNKELAMSGFGNGIVFTQHNLVLVKSVLLACYQTHVRSSKGDDRGGSTHFGNRPSCS